MRKLKLQVQISIDGFIAGTNHEMDWLVWDWGKDISQYVTAITEPVDLILLGKNLAEGFINAWQERAADPNADASTHKFNDTPKMVFSNTLENVTWKNATLAQGDFVDVIQQLKNQEGGDIIAYGGATFVSSLIQKNLIDDLYLFVNPTALGNGLSIFKERTLLTLIDSQTFDCGIVVLHYQPQKATI